MVLSCRIGFPRLSGVSEELTYVEYCCPGETYSISRAVHLARLAGYYPACRDCPRREETAGLSTRQARRLAEVHSRPQGTVSIGPEGVRDVAINDFDPPLARAVAVQFARRLLNQAGERQPTIVFASDGRLCTAAIVAAVVEGIRWTGCEVVDLGAASAPCTASTIEQLEAAGGIYLGNPGGAAHTLGMKFWIGARGADFSPASVETGLESTLLDRPARTIGPLRRFDAAEPYLNALRHAYHALRPLRFVLQCSCEPVVGYLEDLLQNVACRVVPAEPGDEFGQQIVAAKAHFGVQITDDGENARVFDEQGRAVDIERLEVHSADDALRSLTSLLVLLSRDDAALSTVLDRAAGTR